MKAGFSALLLACVAVAGGAEALGKRPASLFPHLPNAGIRVKTATGNHSFSVWIAADDPSRERGLMYVRELPLDQGMLFLFDEPQYAAFWMKNTHISLDLVFIAADGVVVNVATDTTPYSLKPIPSAAPVKAVLELVAGTAARIGLAKHDRVLHPAFAEVQSSSESGNPSPPQ